MIKSMTAFAQAERQIPWGKIICEARSLNHRYLEIAVRLPEEWRSVEPVLREKISHYLKRGKMECVFRFKPANPESDQLVLNKSLVNQLVQLTREVDGLLFNPDRINAIDILRWPGVIEEVDTQHDLVYPEIFSLLDTVLAQLDEGRRREGGKIKEVVEQRCDAISRFIEPLKQRLPEVLKRMRDRLQQRMADVGIADQDRVAQEIVLLAQRLDVEEEIDRLAIHVEEVCRVLQAAYPVGRRLDFLMQELHREANTLGSKSNDIEVTRTALEIKVLIEQMREQIQNIE